MECHGRLRPLLGMALVFGVGAREPEQARLPNIYYIYIIGRVCAQSVIIHSRGLYIIGGEH